MQKNQSNKLLLLQGISAMICSTCCFFCYSRFIRLNGNKEQGQTQPWHWSWKESLGNAVLKQHKLHDTHNVCAPVYTLTYSGTCATSGGIRERIGERLPVLIAPRALFAPEFHHRSTRRSVKPCGLCLSPIGKGLIIVIDYVRAPHHECFQGILGKHRLLDPEWNQETEKPRAVPAWNVNWKGKPPQKDGEYATYWEHIGSSVQQ